MGCCCAPMKGSDNETRLEGKVVVITGKLLMQLSFGFGVFDSKYVETCKQVRTRALARWPH